MLISAFCVFRVANKHTFQASFGRDLGQRSLRPHYRKMLGDVVLAYLTTADAPAAPPGKPHRPGRRDELARLPAPTRPGDESGIGEGTLRLVITTELPNLGANMRFTARSIAAATALVAALLLYDF